MYYLQIERGAPATITNQMLDIWGIDKNDAVNKLWDYAYKNTMEQNTPEFFNSAVLYSVVYNGSYIGLEAVVTLVVISLPSVNKALAYVKNNLV